MADPTDDPPPLPDDSFDWADPPPDDMPTYGVMPDDDGPSTAQAFADALPPPPSSPSADATTTDYTPGMEPPDGGRAATDPMGEAAAALSAAAAELSAAAGQLGGGGGGGGGGESGGSGGGGGWAQGVIQRFAGKVGDKVGGLFGQEAGSAASGGLNKLVGGLFGGGGGAAAGGAAGASGGAAAAAGGAGGGAAAGGAAAGGAGAMAAAGPVGIAVASILTAAEAAKKFHDAVIEGAKAQQAANFQLAEFSAAMASVEALAEVNKTYREMELGDRTAGGAEALQESLDRYEDAILPVREVLSQIWNFLGAIGVDAVAQFFEYAAPFFEWCKNNLESIAKFFLVNLSPDGGGTETFGDMLEFAEREDRKAREQSNWAFDAFEQDRRQRERR